MTKTFIIVFLSFLCNVLFAQEQDFVKEMAENIIQIRQRPDSEQQLREWLSDVVLEEDTIYALLYVPKDCPRCEAAITAFWRILKEVDPNQKMLLITAYPDSTLAKNYVVQEGYQADAHLFDTTEHYKRIFDTNMAGGLMGLHILKIDKRRGNLLTGGEFTVLGKRFVRQLIDYKGMLEKSTFPTASVTDDDSIYTAVPEDIAPLRTFRDYTVNSPVNVSTLFDVPRFVGDRLFFTDVMQNGVMLFTLEDGNIKYNGTLQVDTVERRRFINVPEEVYQQHVRNKMLFYIALGSNFLDDNHIGISYSIPRLVPDSEENSYGIYNAPVVISRNIETMEPDSMLAINFDLENDTMFFNTHFAFVKHKNDIIIGCKKLTWPMEYEREEYENIPDKNPFAQSFYQSCNPFIAAFSATDGNLRKRYGQLDASHASSRTGYYFTSPVATSSGDEFLYTDGYSGKVFIVPDNGKAELCYKVFDIDTSTFPQLDSASFYSYDHVKSYTRFFNRRITDIRFDKKHIYCIVKYAKPDSDEGARYIYTIVNRKNGKTKKYAIPQSAETVLGYGLRLTDSKVTPFSIMKEKSLTTVREYFLKGKLTDKKG